MSKQKQKANAEAETSGVDVRAERTERYKGGVPVRTPDAPAQTAGADNGRSADNEKEKD